MCYFLPGNNIRPESKRNNNDNNNKIIIVIIIIIITIVIIIIVIKITITNKVVSSGFDAQGVYIIFENSSEAFTRGVINRREAFISKLFMGDFVKVNKTSPSPNILLNFLPT